MTAKMSSGGWTQAAPNSSVDPRGRAFTGSVAPCLGPLAQTIDPDW